MTRSILTFSISVILWLGLNSCRKQSEYEQLVAHKYERSASNDSLFLGYYFGMSRKEFYDHSWSLNHKKIVRQGGSNQSVRYEITDLKSRAKINFYPLFFQNSIYRMPVKYAYTGWAPWNRRLWADSLEQDILALFKKKYGYEFEQMKHPEKDKSAYIMIKGNKRISIYQMDDNQHVAVVYTDLDRLNQLKKEE